MNDPMLGSEVADIALRRLEWISRHAEDRCRCRTDLSCRKALRAEVRLTMKIMRDCERWSKGHES